MVANTTYLHCRDGYGRHPRNCRWQHAGQPAANTSEDPRIPATLCGAHGRIKICSIVIYSVAIVHVGYAVGPSNNKAVIAVELAAVADAAGARYIGRIFAGLRRRPTERRRWQWQTSLEVHTAIIQQQQRQNLECMQSTPSPPKYSADSSSEWRPVDRETEGSRHRQRQSRLHSRRCRHLGQCLCRRHCGRTCEDKSHAVIETDCTRNSCLCLFKQH